ncbi:uncharacterized protein N7469_001929 [Penicillium citrinum]|uniref:Uncharacterized protein n=1 Tax=Penicillium citrinum TaxID=5077 RepID=A0A9W9TTQ5_PENCI|nr:uncharacterized protein N7469_001929 [Penicillium citrinum]KAJ5240338.1 hypothetical protein N7469_001929 [Penicillium citrinum]
MFDDLVLEARALNKGMKSQLPGSRRSSPASTSANPSTPTHRPPPQRPIQEKFFISTTYSTITARALSFQGQVLNGVTPLQLAQNGFYYQPHTIGGGLACCFACQNFKRLDSFQRGSFQETQLPHSKDCLWQTIYNDLKQHSQTADTLTPSTNTRPSPRSTHPHHSTSNRTSHKKTTANASTQTPTQSTPTAPSTVEIDSYTPPPSTTLTDPEPQLPPTAHSPQPHQAIPSVTSSPQNQQNTYASVLQRPATSIPQPIPPAQKPALPAKPILTIEDLRRRFHNKPPPFQIENKKSRRSSKRTRNKSVSATKSLSKFLASALPAFSRYLIEMQPKSGPCYPSHPQFHYSRAMRAA